MYNKMSWFYKCWQFSKAMRSDTSLGQRDATEGPVHYGYSLCNLWAYAECNKDYTWGPTGSLGKAQWCSGWGAAGRRSPNKAHFQMEKIQILPLYSHSCTTRGKEVPKGENQGGGRSGRGRGEKERKRHDSSSPGLDSSPVLLGRVTCCLSLSKVKFCSGFDWPGNVELISMKHCGLGLQFLVNSLPLWRENIARCQ